MRFLIDSGAEYSLINPGLCQDKWKSKVNVSLRALNKTSQVDIICRFPIFREFNLVDYYVDFLEYKFHDRFDGLIANNILCGLNAKIDYKNRVLSTDNSHIKLFLNPDEENYYRNAYKDNEVEMFNNEVKKWNILEFIRDDHLNSEERRLLHKLINQNKSVFYKDNDDLTFTSEVKHRILTKDDIPIYNKLYRYPEIHRKEVDSQISEMLRQGIIKESNSAYNSPIWVVPKKVDASGKRSWRIVIDYRKLNLNTIDDRFPIPNVEDIFDKLGKCVYFSKLDLAKGFHQIEMDKRDQHKTAFSTATGHYEFTRMPFGLKNAPATFQRMINRVLHEFINKTCVVYLDDVLVFSTSLEEHINSLKLILRRLYDANLKIQLQKCEFMKKDTEFLGHIISEEGIRPNPSKVSAIQAMKLPKTQKEIKTFLGITSYYRRFIKDYSRIAYPIIKYLKKNARIDLKDKDYVNAFNKLKLYLTTEPVLQYPDFNKKFILVTDASNYAIGGILMQSDHVISYYSRTLNDHEKRYSTIEKELLAIVASTKYFRPYLFGRKFVIKTDHRPLVWLDSLKEPNSKLQRWKIKLNEFDYVIEHVKGKHNSAADALSRLSAQNEIETNNNEEELINSEVHGKSNDISREFDKFIKKHYGNQMEKHTTDNNDQFSTAATIHSAAEDSQNHIPIIEKPINIYKNQLYLYYGIKEKITQKIMHKKVQNIVYVTNNSNLLDIMKRVLFDKGTIVVYCEDNSLYVKFQNLYVKYFSGNKSLRILKTSVKLINIKDLNEALEIITSNHLENNHRGISEMYNELKATYFYPNLQMQIQKFVNNCDVCKLAKHDRNPIKIPFQVTETAKHFNDIMHLDIWFPQRNVMYLTTIDKLSKYATVHLLEDRNWLSILNAIKQRIQFLGKPNKIISDGETCIVHSAVSQYLKENNIAFHKTTAYLKTGNADIERLHGTLNEHLRIMNAAKDTSDLGEKVFKALSIYNRTMHSTTKMKPIDFINKNLTAEDIRALSDKFHEEKVRRIDYLNRKRNSTFNQCENIVTNRTIVKNNPKYRKLNNFCSNGNYTIDKSTKRNTSYHKKQLKRKYKYQST